MDLLTDGFQTVGLHVKDLTVANATTAAARFHPAPLPPSTTVTVRGTTVPTLSEKFTLLTFGPLEITVSRMRVRCSVVRFALPPDWPC